MAGPRRRAWPCRACSAAPKATWSVPESRERGSRPSATRPVGCPSSRAAHLLHPDSQLATWQRRWGPVASPLSWSHAMAILLQTRSADAEAGGRPGSSRARADPGQLGDGRPRGRRRARRGGPRRASGCRARRRGATSPRRRAAGRSTCDPMPATPDANRLRGHRHRHLSGDGGQRLHRRVEGTAGEALVADLGGQRASGHQEHALGDRARLGHHRAEADAREDEDVVGLAHGAIPALPGRRREGAAGGDDGATRRSSRGRPRVSPRPGSRGWRARRRPDARCRSAMAPDDLLVERAGLAGGADEDVRPHRAR